MLYIDFVLFLKGDFERISKYRKNSWPCEKSMILKKRCVVKFHVLSSACEYAHESVNGPLKPKDIRSC